MLSLRGVHVASKQEAFRRLVLDAVLPRHILPVHIIVDISTVRSFDFLFVHSTRSHYTTLMIFFSAK